MSRALNKTYKIHHYDKNERNFIIHSEKEETLPMVNLISDKF